MQSSVATAVLTSWAKPRTHVPQHSSGVAQGTGLATIMLDLDMLVQVHFPCTKHSHATYSFSKVEHHLPLNLSKRPNKTIQYQYHKTVVLDVAIFVRHVLPQRYAEFAFCEFYGKRRNSPRWAAAITRVAAGSPSIQHLGAAAFGMWDHPAG